VQCEILSALWSEHRTDNRFTEFFNTHTLGLVLAFSIDNKIVKTTNTAQKFINETFVAFCDELILDYGDEYYDLDNMLSVLDEED
jgi:hypothetical protein